MRSCRTSWCRRSCREAHEHDIVTTEHLAHPVMQAVLPTKSTPPHCAFSDCAGAESARGASTITESARVDVEATISSRARRRCADAGPAARAGHRALYPPEVRFERPTRAMRHHASASRVGRLPRIDWPRMPPGSERVLGGVMRARRGHLRGASAGLARAVSPGRGGQKQRICAIASLELRVTERRTRRDGGRTS